MPRIDGDIQINRPVDHREMLANVEKRCRKKCVPLPIKF